MALTTTSQMANRYGLNTKLYAYGTEIDEITAGTAEPVMTIDFANLTNISLSGETVWATGGQAHGNQVGFNDPLEGSFTLSTQIVNSQVFQLLAGKDVAEATNSIDFENTADGTIPVYYTITSETVWQDKTGTKYAQDLIFYKAKVKRAFDIEYNGSGDPLSIDIEFELAQNDDGKVCNITNSDVETVGD